MAVTLAGAYYFRGDIGQAVRICRKAIAKAETLDSTVARASAYWNASVFESERGSVGNAVVMAERALALMAEGQDARNLARTAVDGRFDAARARPARRSRRRTGTWTRRPKSCRGAAPARWRSRTTSWLEPARSYLEGEMERAEEICLATFEVANSEAPRARGERRARSSARSRHARGDAEGAKTSFRQAVFFLTGAGADRDAAQLWFELADLLEDVGDLDAARDAYRSAAASTGLRSRSRSRVSV